jgi:hypothetical protein
VVTLSFPNRSRSYDARGRRVRFWGYDGALEISFFLDQSAFSRISSNPKMDETEILIAFDRHRDQIIDVAAKLYSGRRRDAYTLQASDF